MKAIVLIRVVWQLQLEEKKCKILSQSWPWVCSLDVVIIVTATTSTNPYVWDAHLQRQAKEVENGLRKSGDM